jgi:hypothetical protein
MTTTQKLIRDIERYCKREGITPRQFGERVMHDPSFFMRLKNGTDARLSTLERCRAYMKGQSLERPNRLASASAA